MGTIGSLGSTGSIGQVGLVGEIGLVGGIGPLGEVGTAGVIGTMGTIGSLGSTGSIGQMGLVGQTGFTGTIGQTGSVGQNGPIGFTGLAGPDSIVGFNAINGTLWGASPPSTAEEAINRIAAFLYLRTITEGPLNQISSGAGIFGLTNSGSQDVFIVKYNTSGGPLWARRIGGTAADQGYGISTDSSGNVYVTGTYSQTISVFAADGTTSSFSLTNSGAVDTFVVKYNTDGTPQWARKIGGPSSQEVRSISADSSGNVYVTGYYTGTVSVFAADGTTSSFSLAHSGSLDAFVVKYNTAGTPQWGSRISGTQSYLASSISTDTSGNIYVTGRVNSEATIFAANSTFFGSIKHSGDTSTTSAFIVKYNTSGSVLWVRTISGTSNNDKGDAISTDSSGNVYVTGAFDGTTTVFAGNGTTSSFSLTSSGGDDIFIVKYNTDGTPLWARRIGGSSSQRVRSISADSSGNVYVTGNIDGTTTVVAANGSTSFSLTNSSSIDIFIVKYNTDGTPQWARKISGSLSNEGRGISADSSGNVYLSGKFSGTMSVLAADGLTSSFSLSTPLNSDAFVVKYNTDGTPQWVRKISGTIDDEGNGISTDSTGNVYVTGSYGSTQLALFPA